MNYTRFTSFEQQSLFSPDEQPIQQVPPESEPQPDYFLVSSILTGFHNSRPDTLSDWTGRDVNCHLGDLTSDKVCENCSRTMHVNNSSNVHLWHMPVGNTLSRIHFSKKQYWCSQCGHSHYQPLSFQVEGRRITKPLDTFIRDLLTTNKHTLKAIAELTGVDGDIVENIDKKRLQALYTEDGEKLRKTERQPKFLAIDEFKLHNGYIFATHIIALVTVHILWIAKGKKKRSTTSSST